jgi:hypothetical protein
VLHQVQYLLAVQVVEQQTKQVQQLVELQIKQARQVQPVLETRAVTVAFHLTA